LLADQDNKVRKCFGVSSDLFGLIPGRVTYIADEQGIVRHVFNNQVKVSMHVKESIRIIKSFDD